MASQNQLSSQHNPKNTNIISTRRIIRVNKGNGQQPKPALTKPESIPGLKTASPSSSLKKSESQSDQSANQKQYSARNSLRTAQSIAANDKSPNQEGSEHKMAPFHLSPIKDVEDSSNYDILDCEYFLRCTDNNSTVCLLCGIRLVDQMVENHLRSENHNNRFNNLRSQLTTTMPTDDSLQMCAIREYLSNLYRTSSLTNDQFLQRIDVIDQFENLISIVDPACRYRLLGSMTTYTSLISSDINLELLHPNSALFESDPRAKNSIHHKLIDPDAGYGNQINNHTVHYDLIPNAFDTLNKIMHVTHTKYPGSPGNAFEVISTIDDLNGKIPKLILRHIASNVALEIICYAGSIYKRSALLGTYLSLDKRAQILGTLVKYWAKHCKLDNPDKGTYPPDAFLILVIYYLQRTSPPILPCLHEIISKNVKKCDIPPVDKARGPTELMKNLELQDQPLESVVLNGCISTDNSKDVVDEQLPDVNIDNGDEEEEDSEEDGSCFEVDSDLMKNLNWSSENDTPFHKLFIDFLYSMISEFNNISTVISIRTLDKVSLSSKDWTTSIKAIENPVLPRVNISRCIGSPRTFEYLKDAFKRSYHYLTSIPIDTRLKTKNERQLDPADYVELYVHRTRFNSYFQMKESSIKKQCTYDPITQMIKQNLFARDVEVINNLYQSLGSVDLPKTVANFYDQSFLLPKDFLATMYCWLCKKYGHTRVKCPTGKIKRLILESEEYDIELDIRANFDNSFLSLYSRESITPELSEMHNRVLLDLTEIISSIEPNCQLQLFGSTVNDLGSRDSDLDICMTLKGNSTGKDVDCVAILEKVSTVLMENERVGSLDPILGARVPILKFRFDDRFDVDLSMYNLCALFNSELLKTYSKIDQRVAQLFFLVKKFAKCCGIADASRGSLSSYAWSLMVIHYLQHTSPPILPVLQEPNDYHKRDTIGISGWNVWFNNDLRSIKLGVNDLTLTQLFKGFFLYYSNFDFSNYVISIRKSELITRYRKSWNNCMMAIEDPFELTYNLSIRLDDQMAIYIINTFAQAFKHIVQVQRDFIRFNISSLGYPHGRIFRGENITLTGPPCRGCRICGKIGHRFKDCPRKVTQVGPRGTKPRGRHGRG